MKMRDAGTIDMFSDFAPPPAVERFPDVQVRAATMAARMSRAVTATLKAHDSDRAALAKEMSAYLGERVTENMLNQYASQAAQHAIPAHRLVALAVVARDPRLINALLADTGLIAVESKYEALINREMTREAITRLERRATAADAEWKASR